MELGAYFDSIEARLLSDPLVATFDFVDRWQTDLNGYIRVRLTFADGQRLEFAEYTQHSSHGQFEVITYAFQWMAADYGLLCRWDNIPHFPRLPGYPCHRHDGSEDNVLADEPRTIFTVLGEIARRKNKQAVE